MNKGIFITFEGIDGCGKTVQSQLLAKTLEEEGRVVVLTREPGGTALAEEIREVLLFSETQETEKMSKRTELLLFEASRAQHVEGLIKPALKRGVIVISDRFFDSTSAYQGAARSIDQREVEFLNSFAAGGLRPDITFLIDIEPRKAKERQVRRRENVSLGRELKENDRIEKEKEEFYEKVREGFLELVKKEPQRFRVIDGAGETKEIAASIWKEYTEWEKRITA